MSTFSRASELGEFFGGHLDDSVKRGEVVADKIESNVLFPARQIIQPGHRELEAVLVSGASYLFIGALVEPRLRAGKVGGGHIKIVVIAAGGGADFCEHLNVREKDPPEVVVEIDVATVVSHADNGHFNIYVRRTAPVFPVLQKYREGASVNRISEKIISVFLERKKDIENIHIDVQNFFSKERIIPVFIPREGNEDLLKVVPHTPFENLEIIFKYALPELNATATVENKHLKMLDLSAESLLDVALTNGAFTDKIRIQSLTDLAHEISEGFNLDEVMSAEFEKSFYIVTNVSKTYGAAAILDKKVVEAIAEKFDEDVYILPSSIHECIVLPKSMKDLDELRQMVWFINHTEVAPEERLSDEVYLFDSCTKKISIAVNEWERKEQHSMAAPVPSFVL